MRTSAAEVLSVAVHLYAELLEQHRLHLNRINVYPVPDGDTGSNMAMTMGAVVEEVERLAPAEREGIRPLADAVVRGAVTGARGNSGIILSQVLRGFADGLQVDERLEPQGLAGAVERGARAGYESVMRPVEGTMLTVARESSAAAVAAAAAGHSVIAVLEAAADEGRASVARTPLALGALRDAGVVDAGGAGYVLLLDALVAAVSGRLPKQEGKLECEPSAVTMSAVGPRTSSQAKYEVMLLIEGSAAVIDRVKTAWSSLGDSIAIAERDGTWNCHVHTLDVTGALSAVADSGGVPRRVRVTEL